MIFLQEAAFNDAALSGGLFALGIALLIGIMLFFVIIYIYMSLAYSAIARKTKYPSPGIAWIPGIGPLIITSKIAKMHWWPILLLVGFWIPFLNIVLMIALTVFSIIWLWKTYEAISKPGWWAIMNIIQPVGLVMLGIAAWSKQ